MVGFAALQAVSELEANTQNPVRFHVKNHLAKRRSLWSCTSSPPKLHTCSETNWQSDCLATTKNSHLLTAQKDGGLSSKWAFRTSRGHLHAGNRSQSLLISLLVVMFLEPWVGLWPSGEKGRFHPDGSCALRPTPCYRYPSAWHPWRKKRNRCSPPPGPPAGPASARLALSLVLVLQLDFENFSSHVRSSRQRSGKDGQRRGAPPRATGPWVRPLSSFFLFPGRSWPGSPTQSQDR